MGVSAEGTSGSSYSITLLSKHQWVGLHTLSPYSLALPLSRTQTTDSCKVSQFSTPCADTSVLRKKRSKTRDSYYLLVALAPRPAQAFENMHCHLLQESSQWLPKIGSHLPWTLSLCVCVSLPYSTALLLLCGCFRNNPVPPGGSSSAESAAGPAGRAPATPLPLRSLCALAVPGWRELCHRLLRNSNGSGFALKCSVEKYNPMLLPQISATPSEKIKCTVETLDFSLYGNGTSLN